MIGIHMRIFMVSSVQDLNYLRWSIMYYNVCHGRTMVHGRHMRWHMQWYMHDMYTYAHFYGQAWSGSELSAMVNYVL